MFANPTMSSPAKAGDPVTTGLRYAHGIDYSVAEGLLDAPLSRSMTDESFGALNNALISARVLSLTLADLGGEGECVLHAVPDMAGNFDTVSAWPRHERNLMAPYFAANRCDGVTEGQACFWIPGGGSRRKFS